MPGEYKTVLIQTPVWGIYEPPFALSLLQGCLRSKGCEVRVFDMNIELYYSRPPQYDSTWAIEQSILWSSEEFVSEFFRTQNDVIGNYLDNILEYSPGIAGFSVNSASKFSSLRVAGLLKQRNKDIKVIFGGHLFMIDDEVETGSIMESSVVDYIVHGEGETTFPLLIDLISRDDDPQNCPGIVFRDTDGSIKRTAPAEPVKNLDELPFMDFSGLPMDLYEHPEWLGQHLSMQASRGCPWKCAFCGATTYWSGYRVMSGQRLHAEIKHHLAAFPHIEHIEFMDLLFNGKMRSLTDFCDRMIEDPPARSLKWHVNAIIRSEMTPEVLNKMAKAGCVRITYGIESGSQRVLDLMKKNYKIKDAGKVLKATHEAGIMIKANFMFGFPGETESDFQMTLKFLEENSEYINTAYPSFSFCVVEKNSYLGEHMDEFSIVPNPDDNLYWESADGLNDYPERMRRWETFSQCARSLGVDIGIGLNTSLEQHRWINLGYYYKSKGEYQKSLECFDNYLKFDTDNEAVISEIGAIKTKI